MFCNLQIEGLTKHFGVLTLFREIGFSIGEGQRVGLIAKNGAGKTTLLNIIAGKEDYDAGTVAIRTGISMAYLPQDPHYPAELTVLQACFHSENETVQLIAQYEKALAEDNHAALAQILPHIDRLKAWDYEQRAKQILSQLKITDFNQTIGTLSGGQLKRVALANVLIAEPDLLILDEPTNHLDLEMTEWLEEYLSRTRLSLLMVTHDRYFLDRVCNHILEIDNRQLYQYKGNYSYYLERRQERIAAGNAEMERANNLFRKELEWMRRQPQARATKAKSRINAFYELEEKVKQRNTSGTVKLDVQAARIGTKIFEAKRVCKSFGDLKILGDFNYTFARYEKMGIVGNNGTGKSTFIKMLVGKEPPDSGEFDLGETVKFGYYSQEGLAFDEQMKVIDVVQDIAEEITLGDGRRLTASQFLQHFLFTPETQHNYVARLSGGERRRLYLCTVLLRNPNFLVLDEPANDLDIVTLNILEEYLQGFKGCVIVVSHDRYFMDKVVDHLLVFRGNADIKDFPGNYTDYRAWKDEQDKKARQVQQSSKRTAAGNDAKPPDKAPKKKLTFSEQREFEALETDIAALEAEKQALETALNSGLLSHGELTEKSTRFAEVTRLIDDKSFRWLELSEFL
jgi:ATP-binding cassette subfamily F protein uup